MADQTDETELTDWLTAAAPPSHGAVLWLARIAFRRVPVPEHPGPLSRALIAYGLARLVSAGSSHYIEPTVAGLELLQRRAKT